MRPSLDNGERGAPCCGHKLASELCYHIFLTMGGVTNTMKDTTNTARVAGYLAKMFRAINARYFNNEIAEPVITIQSTPRSYGHVTVSKIWHKANGDQCHELNIGAGTLDRPIQEVVGTLMHESVHLWHLGRGVQDCSRGGAYHNKRFRDKAEQCDLKISYDPRIGWSITEPTEALIDFIISQGWEDIHMGRTDGYIRTGPGGTAQPGGGITGGRRPSSTRKLICPKCGQSVRATKKVNILCGDCMERMVEV